MPNGSPPPPPVPGTGPAKKGLSPLAWIAIGCGGLVVVGFVVFIGLSMFVFKKGKEMVQDATGSESFQEMVEGFQENPMGKIAETAIRANPDLDFIESDQDAGTITFRNKKTGEEATLNFDDIAEGRFSMTTSEGEYSIDASDSTEEGGITFKGPEGETRIGSGAELGDVKDWIPLYPGATEAQSAFQTNTAEALAGTLSSETTDDAQTVFDHYKKTFVDEGYDITSESMTKTGKGAFGNLSAEDPESGRTLTVTIIGEDKGTNLMLTYNVKKQ